jgi:hypothetical protein
MIFNSKWCRKLIYLLFVEKIDFYKTAYIFANVTNFAKRQTLKWYSFLRAILDFDAILDARVETSMTENLLQANTQHIASKKS